MILKSFTRNIDVFVDTFEGLFVIRWKGESWTVQTKKTKISSVHGNEKSKSRKERIRQRCKLIAAIHCFWRKGRGEELRCTKVSPLKVSMNWTNEGSSEQREDRWKTTERNEERDGEWSVRNGTEMQRCRETGRQRAVGKKRLANQ